MRVLLGGVRGSTPVSDAAYLRYGGCTTSILVEGTKGTRVLIDAGSGLRVISDYLQQIGPIRTLPILMTHYHLDHIIGFPSFSALYNPRCTLNLAAPDLNGIKVQQALSRVMDNPFWPVQLEASAARLTFSSLGDTPQRDPLIMGELEVRWCPVNHPGGCTAYRLDEPATGASMVLATDMEWQISSPREREAFIEFCLSPGPPDLLIADGQYTNDNYPSHRGWGHSTWQDALDVAAAVRARRLLVTHHCPSMNDAALDRIDAALRGGNGNAALARQGEHWTVGSAQA